MISLQVRRVDLAVQWELAAREVTAVAEGNGSNGHHGAGSTLNEVEVGP